MKQIEINSLLVSGLLRKRYFVVREYGLVEIKKQLVDGDPAKLNRVLAFLKSLVAKVKSLRRSPPTPEQ